MSKEIEMQWPDALRSMYFFDFFEEVERKLETRLEKASENIAPVLQYLIDEADQIVLGLLPHCVREARRSGLLRGNFPIERYESFFHVDGQWTDRARGILAEYPRLRVVLHLLFDNACNNVKEMLIRLEHDAPALEFHFGITKAEKIARVAVLNGDPHNHGRQPLLITFPSGLKVVYKPTSLKAFDLMRRVIELLELGAPFRPRFPKIIALASTHSWMEWVEYQSCSSEAEVADFYLNAGAWLGLMFLLQFNDGHRSNVIASGSELITIDGESCFQNFSHYTKSSGGISVLLTHFLEDSAVRGKNDGLTAALQANGAYQHALTKPFVTRERTPRIRTRYDYWKPVQIRNLPSLDGRIMGPDQYVDQVVKGFQYACRQVKYQSQRLLNDSGLWDELFYTRTRFLLRSTLFYLYCLRMQERPEVLRSANYTERMLRALFAPDAARNCLGQQALGYELTSLMRDRDVPVFSTIVGECHLYDGYGQRYPNFFPEPALVQLRRNIEKTPRVEQQVELIRRVLT